MMQFSRVTYTSRLFVFAHIAGWLLFISLILGFAVSGPADGQLWDLMLSPPFLLFIFVYVFLFYINSYVLIPELYLKKNYTVYFILIAALFVVVYFLRPFDQLVADHHASPGDMGPPPMFEEDGPPPEGRERGGGRPGIDIVSMVLFVMVWSSGTAIQIVKQWRTTERRAIQAEADKTRAELSFLRAQINPHFLFNTLNNIYSLILTKNDAAPDAVLKLSHIMRYVTDEATQNWVPLEWEVQCISRYIDLQRLRLNDKTTVDFQVEGEMDGMQIPPLILMTFVENVFKHGVSNHEPSPISIKITVKEQEITFQCFNKINPQSIPERKGIGIENTKTRLNQLYPGKHNLYIGDARGDFGVILKLCS